MANRLYGKRQVQNMLQGKKALITGGSRGIGRAIALEMAKNGADVAICYTAGKDAAEQVTAEIEKMGHKAKAYCCDVKNAQQCKDVVKEMVADFGNIDILVNNAGIIRDGLLLTMKEDDFDTVIATNLKGAFNMIKASGMYFLKQKQGTILNISSVSGMMGNAGQSNYAASKAGLIGLTKTVAKELASKGVTCNAIAPGFIRTDMTDSMPEKQKNTLLEAIPLKKLGETEDVAKLAVFLASPWAQYITGEVVKVDGGLYM